jgi:hypothetical protein
MSDNQDRKDQPSRGGGQPADLDQLSRRTAGQDTYQSDDNRHENINQTRAGQHGNSQQANTGSSQSGESEGGRTRVDERAGQQGNWNEPGRAGNLQSEDAPHSSKRGGNTTQEGEHKGSLQSGGRTQGNMQSEGRGQHAQPAGSQDADSMRTDREQTRDLRGRTEQPGIGNKYDSDDEKQ